MNDTLTHKIWPPFLRRRRCSRPLAALIAAAALLAGASSCRRGPDTDAMAALYASELRQTDKLVLATMTVGKMATVRDLPFSEARGWRQSADALLNSMKIGSRVATYSFNTHIDAYIDLSALSASDFRFSADGKEVTVTLPPIMTEFSGRDLEMREEHYRVTGMRSQVDAPERARLKQEMTDSLIREIREDPAYAAALTDKARAKAQTFFRDLFEARGVSATVVFSDK